MKHYIRTGILVLLVSLYPYAGIYSQSFSQSSESCHLLEEINRIRVNHGVPAIEADEPSSLAAVKHAEELEERQVLSHRGLDGFRVTQRYRSAGGTGLRAAENLGAGENLESIINGWMNSPSHRDNIMNPEWFYAGAGIVHSGENRIIVVLVFNDSRWKTTVFTSDDNAVTMDGRLKLHPGSVPDMVVLKNAGREIMPETAELNPDNSISIHFVFPEPEEWIPGEDTAFELAVFEKGEYRKTDLFFLRVPSLSAQVSAD